MQPKISGFFKRRKWPQIRTGSSYSFPIRIDNPRYLILPYPIVVTSDKIMHGEDALAHVLRGEKQLVIPFSFL